MKSKAAIYGKKAKKERTFILLMLGWPILHLLFFNVFINIETFKISLYRYVDGAGSFAGFLHYKNIFKEVFVYKGNLKYALLNSLSFIPLNVLVILPLAILFSYFLSKKISGYGTFRVIFFLPSIISVVVIIMAFKYMFNESFGPVSIVLKKLGLGSIIPRYGWFGTRASSYRMLWLYMIWSGIGHNIVLLQGAMMRVPSEILESGRIDGAGMARELLQLIVPNIFTTISTMILFGCMSTFTVFIQPQLMFGMNLPDRFTVSLNIVMQTKMGNLNSQAGAAALGVILMIVGAPLMIGLKSLLNRLTPEVDY